MSMEQNQPASFVTAVRMKSSPVLIDKSLTPQRKFKKAVFKLKIVQALSTAKYLSSIKLSKKDIDDGYILFTI
jgi:hypothetical protein